MYAWRRALMVAIALSSLMPLTVGILAIADRARLLAMLHIAPSGDATTRPNTGLPTKAPGKAKRSQAIPNHQAWSSGTQAIAQL